MRRGWSIGFIEPTPNRPSLGWVTIVAYYEVVRSSMLPCGQVVADQSGMADSRVVVLARAAPRSITQPSRSVGGTASVRLEPDRSCGTERALNL